MSFIIYKNLKYLIVNKISTIIKIHKMSVYFTVEKFTPRFAFVECPECGKKQRIEWSTRNKECKCKGCKTEGWIILPWYDVNDYLDKCNDIESSISYYEKFANIYKNKLTKLRELAKKKNLYIPSCDDCDYCVYNYGYNSDEDELIEEIRSNELIEDIRSYEISLIHCEKSLEESKNRLKEHKDYNNNEKFYNMIMKNYSKPSQVKKTLRIDAAFIGERCFGYKCPYCNNIHSHGCGFNGINERSTHCRMVFPNGLEHNSVEVIIHENTPIHSI